MSKAIIKDFNNFLDYVNSIEEDVWSKPISEGKWNVSEVISQLINWDKYSIEKMLPLMKDNANLPEFIDHDRHNKDAIDLAKKYKEINLIKNEFKETRKKLLEMIDMISPDIRFTIGSGKMKYSIEGYVKIFVHHDEHHKKQITKTQ